MAILFDLKEKNKKGKYETALNLFSKNKCIQSLDFLLEQKFERENSPFNPDLPQISEKEEDIETFAKHTSLESMSLEKLRVFKLYLRTFKHELDISTEEKSTKLISIIDDFLDVKKYRIYFENKYIYRAMVYGYTPKKDIGRLYCIGNSLQRLPRIYRRFLLGGRYIDVDIVNAHPCILLEYAELHEISCYTLTFLVKNRDTFYKEVSQQISVDNVKQEVISTLNKTKFFSSSILLSSLFKEIVEIRESLWTTFYYPNKDSFDSRKKNKTDLKVTVQSLYCQTKETDHIIALYNHLHSQTDGNKEELHFIPFFDGALVKFKDYVKHTYINTFIEQFNETTKYVKFKIKDFEEGFYPTDNFLRLQRICNVLPKLYRNEISFLKKKLKIKDEIFENELINYISEKAKKQKIIYLEIQKKLDENIKLEKSLKKEILDKKPPDLEEKLKQVIIQIEELKASSYPNRYYHLAPDEKKRIEDCVLEFEKKLIMGLLEHADSELSLTNFIKMKIKPENEFESKELE